VTELPDLTQAFERSGLLDVAYTLEDSPVGLLLLAATPVGLARVAYLEAGGSPRGSSAPPPASTSPAASWSASSTASSRASRCRSTGG
jgi:hypothetical protein